MSTLSLRGLIAPLFIALAIGAGVLNLWVDSSDLFWLGLFFCALALAFARYTHALFIEGMKALRGSR